jgi:hypothetical protein
VVPRTFIVLFAEHTSGGPPTYFSTKERGVRPPELAYVGLVFDVYFLMSQGIIRLALRVLDLVKTILLKTLLSTFMEKISINKNVCFYRGITITSSSHRKIIQLTTRQLRQHMLQ